MKVKDREIFVLNNFRGIDTENKPLKVAPYRASYGKNFIIYSETLRTRPAIKLENKEFLNKYYEIIDKEIIDWYEYGDTRIFVGNKGFYVYYQDELRMFESYYDPELGILVGYDFSGLKPLFQEEKEALFIFCLDKVYVFTLIDNEFSTTGKDFILYDISAKPSNPYDEDTEEYNAYEELPKPYEPTLYIGSNAHEDVNLLSNVVKYDLFAETSDSDTSTYYLPTHYDMETMGDYTEELTFYKNKFGELQAFPVFLGIEEEHITEEDLDEMEDEIVEDFKATIANSFYPLENFEFTVNVNTTPVEVIPVKMITGLKRDDFFRMKVKGADSVFEYCVNYIRTNPMTNLVNRILKFDLPVEYMATFRDVETQDILSIKKEKRIFTVYVRLFSATTPEISLISGKNVINWGSEYPSFPILDNSAGIEDFEIPEPIQYADENVFPMEGNITMNKNKELFDIARDYVLQNISDFEAYDKVIIHGRTFTNAYNGKSAFAVMLLLDLDAVIYKEGLYKFGYEDGAFKLELKNYFFDYNNEPSINVKITFENNPNYDLIKNTRFGITFGSENRLFLAGNKDYPNIDRFNISNNLLGDNVKNQSYELSYFPSKNYRVLGGKGAINGYVIATDSQLYVTKVDYKNDAKLFVRVRTMDDNGVVGYNEFKTSTKHTPLNNRCIVRFNNDILMLTKEGLYAIELSSQVLTDERLERLRSFLVNTELKNHVKNATNEIFIVENDKYLYMVIDDKMYVIDTNYMVDINGIVNYEFMYWEHDLEFVGGKIIDNEIVLLAKNESFLYKLENDNFDDKYVYKPLTLVNTNIGINNAFILNESLGLTAPYEDYVLVLKDGFKQMVVKNVDYEVVDNILNVINYLAFRDISNGDVLYYFEDNTYKPFIVSGFDGQMMPFAINADKLYREIDYVNLYITHVFEKDGIYYFRLSPYKPSVVVYEEEYIDNNNYYFLNSEMQDVFINTPQEIVVEWFSNISDFGSNIMEKTSFKTFVYARKLSQGNTLEFGYRTMKDNLVVREKVDLSNPIDFSEVNFNVFSLVTFDEIGMSFPMKTNNFLYMQVYLKGSGQVELNAIEIMYKNNRIVKTVG